jgi:hypothetical protein
MKKASINMLLLLSNVYDKKDLSNLHKDLREVSGPALEAILQKLEAHKAKVANTVSEELEKEARRIAEEKDEARKKREAVDGTAAEITHLLLTRYALKPAAVAIGLSNQLALVGYQTALTERPTKAAVAKWLKGLAENVPREKLLNLAMNLRPPS